MLKKIIITIIFVFLFAPLAQQVMAEVPVVQPVVTKSQINGALGDLKESLEHGHLARKEDRTRQIVRDEAKNIKTELGGKINTIADNVIAGLKNPLEDIATNAKNSADNSLVIKNAMKSLAKDAKEAKTVAIKTKKANASGVRSIISHLLSSFWYLVLTVVLVGAVIIAWIIHNHEKVIKTVQSHNSNTMSMLMSIEAKVDSVPAKTAELVKKLEPIVITVKLNEKVITYIPQIIEGKYLSLRVLKQAGDASNPAEILRGFKGNAAKLHRDTVEVMAAFLNGEFDDISNPYARKQMEVIRYEQTPQGGLRIA